MSGNWLESRTGGITGKLMLLAALSGSVWLTPELARAQSDEQRAGARALATEGARAFNEGRFKDAVDLFTRAEALVHAPPHLLFLARAHAKLGQFVKAREAYLKIIKEQLAPNAPQAFRDAQKAAEEERKAVEPKIGSLLVRVEGAETVKDLSVTLDGQPFSTLLLGVPQPVDPGQHQLAASAPGWKARPVTVTLKDAERQTATLKLEVDESTQPVAAPVGPVEATAAAPPPAASAPTAVDNTERDAAPASGSSGMRVGSYVAFGASAVGIGLGSVFLMGSISNRKDADDAAKKLEARCGDLCSADDPEAKKVTQLDDDAASAQTLAIVGYALGGAGIATGITLLILSGEKEAPKSAHIEPFFGIGSAGIRGSF
jgi:hypothetical protein